MGYVESGRTNQKRRTRDALIAAARGLVMRGSTPSVEEAAAAAGISRTTAYRYFPSQRSLLAAAYPEIQSPSLLPPTVSVDPAARLDAVLDTTLSMIVDQEPQYRTMLRLSLEATPEERAQLLLRQGRAIRWIEEALAPLADRLARKDLHRLALAIRATTGIESLVWLTDVAGLDRREATALMRASAHALLEHAISGPDGSPARAPRQRRSSSPAHVTQEPRVSRRRTRRR